MYCACGLIFIHIIYTCMYDNFIIFSAKVDDSETVKSDKLEEVLKAQAQLQEEKQIITG